MGLREASPSTCSQHSEPGFPAEAQDTGHSSCGSPGESRRPGILRGAPVAGGRQGPVRCCCLRPLTLDGAPGPGAWEAAGPCFRRRAQTEATAVFWVFCAFPKRRLSRARVGGRGLAWEPVQGPR